MIIYVYKINKFVSYNRVDGYKEYFGLTNLFFWKCKCSYMNIHHVTYNNMFQNGLKYIRKSCTITLLMYGSTIGATIYPQFIEDDEYKILPRPYHTSKP